MARERIVSRTISATVYTVLTVTIPENTVANKEFTLSSVPESIKPDKLMNLLKKSYETDTCKLVSIIAQNTVMKRYGMPEVDFLKYAKEMPLLPVVDEKDEEPAPAPAPKSNKRNKK